MKLIPPPLFIAFLHRYHVLSLACTDGKQLWAASCFYAFDEAHCRLLILTSPTTLHGRLMCDHPEVVGTIAAQPTILHEIEGMQFRATAYRITEAEQADAFACYFARHPIAQGQGGTIWGLSLHYLKHTENRTQFAYKTEWAAS